MNEDFLEKRSAGLVKWLEVLMSHDFFEKSLDIKKVWGAVLWRLSTSTDDACRRSPSF